MKFVELSSEEFNKVSNNFLGSNFYQSYEWSKLKESIGWKHYYVGVLKDNTLVAVTILIAQSDPKEKEVLVDLVMNFLEK